MKTSIFQPKGTVARFLIMTLNKIWVDEALCVLMDDKYLLASRMHSETMLITKLPTRLVIVLIIDGSKQETVP